MRTDPDASWVLQPPGVFEISTPGGESWTVTSALGFWERGRGWLGKSKIDPGEALFFPRCRSVHTWFMKTPIDLLFLDANGTAAALFHEVPAWRMRSCRASVSVLELAPGALKAAGLKVGDPLLKG